MFQTPWLVQSFKCLHVCIWLAGTVEVSLMVTGSEILIGTGVYQGILWLLSFSLEFKYRRMRIVGFATSAGGQGGFLGERG